MIPVRLSARKRQLEALFVVISLVVNDMKQIMENTVRAVERDVFKN